MSAEGTWAWTGSVGFPPCRVWVPEVRIDSVPDGCDVEPLRGSAHTLAVFRGSTCIGWTLAEQKQA